MRVKLEFVHLARFVYIGDMTAAFAKPTQLCSEGFPDAIPFRLVGRVILLYCFHHQVHNVEQHSEICAVRKGDGWFPNSTTAGSTITERENTNV